MSQQFNVLFLCTGNSARSIMAEAILNGKRNPHFTAYSAGSLPSGTVRPEALKQLRAANLPTEGARSKSWGEFSKPDAPEMNFVFTVCDNAAAEAMARYIRGHWTVENNLHWQLDVSFGEDQRRIRKGHGAENFSRLSRIALNLLKRNTSVKAGIKGKRLNAGWDHDYLLSLISQ